ncbi:MAG: hypothetical protein JWP75_721, partial [Frondihabitans sp.]|nr:hypothetical protein [Frondihabitans sp.]
MVLKPALFRVAVFVAAAPLTPLPLSTVTVTSDGFIVTVELLPLDDEV